MIEITYTKVIYIFFKNSNEFEVGKLQRTLFSHFDEKGHVYVHTLLLKACSVTDRKLVGSDNGTVDWDGGGGGLYLYTRWIWDTQAWGRP